MTGLEIAVVVFMGLWSVGHLITDYLKHRETMRRNKEWIRLYEQDSETFADLLREVSHRNVMIRDGSPLDRADVKLLRNHLERLSREDRRPS